MSPCKALLLLNAAHHSDAFSGAGKCASMGFERSSVFGGVILIMIEPGSPIGAWPFLLPGVDSAMGRGHYNAQLRL
jgi:hypothetical protein